MTLTLIRFDPFRDLERFTEQTLARGPRAMPMEALRREAQFVVALDLPGVVPNDAEVTVECDVATVRACRAPRCHEGDELLADERPQGEFSRQFLSGDNLGGTQLSAEFDRGVLLHGIPVAEVGKPRRVEIGSSAKKTEKMLQIADRASRHEDANV